MVPVRIDTFVSVDIPFTGLHQRQQGFYSRFLVVDGVSERRTYLPRIRYHSERRMSTLLNTIVIFQNIPDVYVLFAVRFAYVQRHRKKPFAWIVQRVCKFQEIENVLSQRSFTNEFDILVGGGGGDNRSEVASCAKLNDTEWATGDLFCTQCPKSIDQNTCKGWTASEEDCRKCDSDASKDSPEYIAKENYIQVTDVYKCRRNWTIADVIDDLANNIPGEIWNNTTDIFSKIKTIIIYAIGIVIVFVVVALCVWVWRFVSVKSGGDGGAPIIIEEREHEHEHEL